MAGDAARYDEWQLRLSQSWQARSLVLLAATALALVNALAVARGQGDPRVVEQTTEGLRLVTVALFFGAGVIQVSRWRLSGDSRSALVGVAFIVAGSLTFPLSRAAALLRTTESQLTLNPLTGLMTTFVAAALVLAAIRVPQEQPNMRLGRLTMLAIGVPLGGLVLLDLIRRWLVLDLDPSPRLHMTVELVMGVVWIGLALAMARTRQAMHENWAPRAAPLMVGMALVSVFRSAAAHDPGPWGLGAATLAVTIAALALMAAMVDVAESTTHERRHLQDVNGALARAENALSAHDDWRQELAHDAHNASAAMTMTMTTLFRYGDRLDDETAERLRAGALAEIGHLMHLIDRSGEGTAADFDVDAVIRPTAEALRVTGLDVTLHTQDCWAHGNAADFATVVRNLLDNALSHGHGRGISVTVGAVGDSIQVRVGDRGPGMPGQLRVTAFERGVRGEQSRGAGLGLHVARTLMLEQNGSIDLLNRTGGGTVVVLTLPTATNRTNGSRSSNHLEPVAS